MRTYFISIISKLRNRKYPSFSLFRDVVIFLHQIKTFEKRNFAISLSQPDCSICIVWLKIYYQTRKRWRPKVERKRVDRHCIGTTIEEIYNGDYWPLIIAVNVVSVPWNQIIHRNRQKNVLKRIRNVNNLISNMIRRNVFRLCMFTEHGTSVNAVLQTWPNAVLVGWLCIISTIQETTIYSVFCSDFGDLYTPFTGESYVGVIPLRDQFDWEMISCLWIISGTVFWGSNFDMIARGT